MQTRLGWMIAVGVGGLVTAATALAHSATRGVGYTGTGVDYMNNARVWTNEGSARISFDTSSHPDTVRNFKGTYSFYCGSGTATVTDRSMPVAQNGTFGTRFTVSNRGPSGKRNGSAHVEITGAFHSRRRTATISYLVDYVFKGRYVKHPYDTKHPRRLGCASWVKGTVTMKTPSTSPSPHPRPNQNPHSGGS